MKKLLQLFILMSFAIANSQTPIQEFNFDSSFANVAGNANFTTNQPHVFGTDRNGIANNALQLQGVIFGGQHYLSANLTNLPVGNEARTISLWLKCSSFVDNANIYPFGYGTQSPNQAFGIQQNSPSSSTNQNRLEVYGFGPSTNNIGVVASPVALDQWYHYVITHDGVNTTKLYRNNTLLLTATKTWNTVGTVVTIGKIIAGTYNDGIAVSGFIDDLKIYNVALTDAQIASLYTSSSSVVTPTVSNVSATNVGSTSATINYTINANNATTLSEVRYSVSPGGTLQTQTGPSVSGTTNTNLTQILTGLLPNTTYEYNVWAFNSEGTAFLPTSLYFTTLAGASVPVISETNFISSTSTDGTIFFDINPNEATTTTNIVFNQVGAGIGSVIAGPTVSGNTTQTVYFTIPNLASGTCYTYRVEATNNSGNATPSNTAGFCTIDADFNKVPFYHFQFNGNTQEKSDPTIAFGNPNSGFVDNNTAVRLNNNVQAINLPLLPQGFRKRTVAIRFMFESGALSQANNVFSYGAAATGQSFGYTQETASQATHYFWNNDFSFSNPMNFGTYYTMVFVFDGLDTKIYRDGNNIYNGSISFNTVGTIFRIGRTTTGVDGFFNGRIDDLRIYNDDLSSGDVNQLMSALSVNSFKGDLEIGLYPNPTNDVLNITIENEIKSVEIYSLQGQKVLSSTEKSVNVSSLSSGMYMVRVDDVNGATATQKLIKK